MGETRTVNRLSFPQVIELTAYLNSHKEDAAKQTADEFAKAACAVLPFPVTKANVEFVAEKLGITFREPTPNNGMMNAISAAREDSREARKAAEEANFVAADLLRRVKSLEEQFHDLKTRLGEPTPEAR